MENRVSTWSLRILDIDDPKIVQKLAFFLGIDINVFMGDPSTLSLSLVLVAALLATFKDTALFFVCKRTMSEMKSCISSILNWNLTNFNLEYLSWLPIVCLPFILMPREKYLLVQIKIPPISIDLVISSP